MFKDVAKSVCPPFLLSLLRAHKEIKWLGNYTSWDQALLDCAGYDDETILDKVKDSALKVKKGEAAFERDGVTFKEYQYRWPMIASLMMAASSNNNTLDILDFGGSLGSAYYQNIQFLKLLNDVKWGVVEQPHFVECGKEHFVNEHLNFYLSIEECLEAQNPNILFLGSVLQYLKDPYPLLDTLLNYKFKFLFLDRTTINVKNKMRLVRQIVPPTIYSASYPCWLFSEDEMKSYFEKNHYQLLAESICEDFKSCKSKGYLFTL